MDIQRMQQLAGMPVTQAETLTEAKSKVVKFGGVEMQQFKGSDEFEDAMADAFDAIKHAKAVLESAAFKHWMRESVNNYGFKMSSYNAAVTQIEKANEKLEAMYQELADAAEE
jgi:hypothetical protein